jgi:hypothetical protein
MMHQLLWYRQPTGQLQGPALRLGVHAILVYTGPKRVTTRPGVAHVLPHQVQGRAQPAAEDGVWGVQCRQQVLDAHRLQPHTGVTLWHTLGVLHSEISSEKAAARALVSFMRSIRKEPSSRLLLDLTFRTQIARRAAGGKPVNVVVAAVVTGRQPARHQLHVMRNTCATSTAAVATPCR